MRAERTQPLRAVLLVPAVACLTTIAGASPRVVQDDAFRPIRFGDDDERRYDEPFFPGTEYDASVPTPDALLGQPVGSRLAHPAEIVRYFERLGAASPRVDVAEYGRTFENRPLLRVVITSAANQARTADWKRAIARLSDPRGLTDAEAQEILANTPAIAWMGYSIHGDETSGADASLAVGYHLAAGTSADVTSLLDEVVVVMDPCMNPDGRERILSLIEQSAGYVGNLDDRSMHRGRWPFGRGHHYLFDINRDWMVGTAPETRGRWKVALEFRPQLFVDAHEMSGLDTYLFYPQADPLHPALPETLMKWQKAFAADHAAAFDGHGWGYYTREWADGWGVFYSDAWGSLNGAIGLLYEQASVGGQPLKRESGEVVSYRESVHGQAVSSLANLSTLRAHRAEILADYLAGRRRNVDASRPGGERAFVLVPGRSPEREAAFLRTLVAQGIEVFRATEEFVGRASESSLGLEEETHAFPAGTYLVPATQPQAPLVLGYLGFDPRMDSESLLEERRSLERKNESKMYDVTAWDLGRAFDLDAYWCTPADVQRERMLEVSEPPPGVVPPRAAGAPVYAWVVDGTDPASVAFAARAMELGLAVHLADEEFTAEGRAFARGSLLLRRHENPPDPGPLVARAARDTGVRVFATTTGRSLDEGPDLGGGHFQLLHRPRVALLANSPVSPSGYGHVWHQLDERLRLPLTILDAQAFGSHDLRRYNVLVVPEASGIGSVLRPHAENLRAWVRSGGTLIACGQSSAGLLGEELGLSSVVRRRDALEDLEAYAFAAGRERDARTIEIDEAELWDEGPPAETAESEGAAGGEEEGGDEANESEKKGETDLERRDSWMRRFSPSGVFLRGLVDDEAWITVGLGDELPVFYSGSSVYLSREPVRTPVRLAESERLRLGGLLWPEARERIADSAWLTVESKGHGQVILFAAPPAFRGSFPGMARLLANAVVYGPGAGASPPRNR